MTRTTTYTVVRHDTLWGIAERYLRDPLRWPEIFELNKQRTQTDGRIFINPDRIHPGWVLQLPADATGLEEPEALPDQKELVPNTPKITPKVTNPSTPTSPPVVANDPLVPHVQTSRPAADGEEIDHRDDDRDLPAIPILSASLIAGVGALLGLLRLRRRRRYQLQRPAPGISWHEPLVDDNVHATQRETFVVDAADEGSARDASEKTLVRSALFHAMHDHDRVVSSDVARAIVVEALVQSETEITIATPSLVDVLFGTCVNNNITITDSNKQALIALDSAVVSRKRLLDDAEVASIAAYRDLYPGEPVPSLLFVFLVDLQAEVAQRMTTAEQLEIAVVLVDHEMATEDDTLALSIAQATSVMNIARAASDDTCDDAAFPIAEPFNVPQVQEIETTETRAVSVSVFGPVRVMAGDKEIANELRTKAREMIAFLALRPEGATWEAIGAALWPEADGRRTNQRFRTTLSNLRTTLRNATGLEEKFIASVGERYALQPALFECDIWRFQDGLTRANASRVNDADVLAALMCAVDAYAGELAQDAYYEWAEAPREDLRRRVLDALGRIAELQQHNGNDDEALATLERAVTIDPYCEELYQRIMSIHATNNRRDAVLRTYRALERRLGELDVEPTQRTLSLLQKFAA